jgi:hypothetical protein
MQLLQQLKLQNNHETIHVKIIRIDFFKFILFFLVLRFKQLKKTTFITKFATTTTQHNEIQQSI